MKISKLSLIASLVLGMLGAYSVVVPSITMGESILGGCFKCEECRKTTYDDCSSIDCGTGDFMQCYMSYEGTGGDGCYTTSGNGCSYSSGFCSFDECTSCKP